MVGRGLHVVVLAGTALAGCGRVGYEGRGAFEVAVDAGAPDARSALECASAPPSLVCSGFERDVDTYWRIETVLDGRIDSGCLTPHGGDDCLVARIDQGGAAARVEREFPAQSSGTLYMRLYAYVDPTASIQGVTVAALHASTARLNGPDVNLASGDRVELYLQESDREWSLPMPRGEWFCVALAVTIADVGGFLSLQVGDQPAREIADVDTSPGGAYDRAIVGIGWSEASQQPVGVLVDDVIVTRTPVDCADP
jgi:hypothetical protein